MSAASHPFDLRSFGAEPKRPANMDDYYYAYEYDGADAL